MEFTKKKIEVMGSVEVHITEVAPKNNQPFPPFAFIATKEGVRWEGKTTLITSMAELQELAKQAAQAWKEHKSLVPKIVMARESPGPLVN